MGLDAKKYTQFYSTSGTDADKIANDKSILQQVREIVYWGKYTKDRLNDQFKF